MIPIKSRPTGSARLVRGDPNAATKQESVLKTIRFIASVGCAALVSGGAAAQSPPSSQAQGLLDGSVVVNVGAFVLNSNIRANLNGRSSRDSEIDFEEVFGRSSDATRVRADILWRITPTHHLRFMYFDNDVDRSRAVDRQLSWGDYTYRAGANLEFSQELEIFQLAYEYAFVRRPTYQVAGSVGLHLTELTVRLAGDATLVRPDGSTQTVAGSTQSNSLLAPLPVVGVRWGWVAAPDWYIDALAQYFRAGVAGYDGYWSDLRVGATWMYTRNVGIGLGYNRFTTRLKVDRSGFDGRLSMGYSGLQAYLTFAF